MNQPFYLGSNTESGRWQATLRRRDASLDIVDDSHRPGDGIYVLGPDAAKYRITLQQAMGTFQKGVSAEFRLVATRLPQKEQVAVAGEYVDFFVDIEAEWADHVGGNRVKHVSLPVRAVVNQNGPGTAVVAFVLLGGMIALAVFVLLRR